MDRVEIKNKAKEMIKGNKWFIWKPLVILMLCVAFITAIATGLDSALGLSKETVTEMFGTQVKGTVGPISSIV